MLWLHTHVTCYIELNTCCWFQLTQSDMFVSTIYRKWRVNSWKIPQNIQDIMWCIWCYSLGAREFIIELYAVSQQTKTKQMLFSKLVFINKFSFLFTHIEIYAILSFVWIYTHLTVNRWVILVTEFVVFTGFYYSIIWFRQFIFQK